MNELDYRIMKVRIQKQTITNLTTIELFDYDDICMELRKMEDLHQIRQLKINGEKVDFRLTFLGTCSYLASAIKRIFNYLYAILVSIVITAFLFASFPAYQNLVEAWENQNEVSITFYAAQIGFYLTIVVVTISFITLLANSRSKTDEMLFKVQQEIKKIRKQSSDSLPVKFSQIEGRCNETNKTLSDINENLIKLVTLSKSNTMMKAKEKPKTKIKVNK